MGRLSLANRKYMSKTDMAISLVEIHQLCNTSGLSLANVHILMDHVLWAWTEFGGKYKGCSWWSDRAYEQFQNRNTNRTKGLIHEHVVPREIIRKKIVDKLKESCTHQQLYDFLERHLLACVITKEEDLLLRNSGLKMNLGAELDDNNTWIRYEVAEITRRQIEW